jgi:hypothetical protein
VVDPQARKAELKRLIEIATVTGYGDDVAKYTTELQELTRKERK